MHDPIEARRIEALLRRLADDARAGALADVEEYRAAFPSLGDRVRVEYDALVTGSSSGDGDGGSFGAPIDGARVGPYLIERELGRGGQGVVYLAEDTRHRRRVALKVLPTPLGLRSARVRREIDAIARLDHPGLCVVYDAGEADGRAYVAMRHVQGEPLDAQLRTWSGEGRPRSGSRARGEVAARVELVEKLARALHAAHEVGVTHRDVKPANVLVRDDGDPVLLDFGLAHLDDDAATLTHSGELVGTLPYMAPERFGGAAGDTPTADVWSLGVTLYEVLSGRRPFEAPTLDAVARRIERDEPTDLARVASGVPRDLAVVVATALDKDPMKRYPTAAAFADDLERWRTGCPITARPVGVVGRLVRWSRRNPAAAALVAVLVVALGASLVVSERLSDLVDREGEARRAAQSALAGEERARRIAEATVVRGAYEQARLELRARRPAAAFASAERATTTYAALDVTEGADDPELSAALAALPTSAELRALHAELSGLLRVDHERVVQRSTFGQGALSADGAFLVQGWIKDDMSSYGVRVVDVATGDEVGRLTDYDLMSTRFSLAVTDDGRFCLAPRRDLAALGLWSLESGRCEVWLDVPEDFVDPTSRDGVWRPAFADEGRRVVAVLTSRAGPDAVVVWRHGVDLAAPRDALPYATAASLDLPHVAPERVVRGPIAPDAWITPTDDDRVVLVPGDAGVVRRVDVTSGEETAFTLEHDVDAVCSLGDGFVALSRGGELSRVDASGAATSPIALDVEPWPVVAVAPDGSALALVDADRSLHLVDPFSGEALGRVPAAFEETPSIDALRFTDDAAALVGHPARGSTAVWRVDTARGWCGGPLVRPTRDARSWALDVSGRALVEVLPDGTAVRRDVERRVALEGDWDGVRFAGGAWALRGASRVQRVTASGRGPLVDVGGPVADAVPHGDGLRVVVDAGTQLELLDVGAAGELSRVATFDVPAARDVLLSDEGERLLVAPLTGARETQRLSTGAVLVHRVGADEATLLEGLDAGFRKIDAPRLSPDGRFVVAHVFRPTDDELDGGEDHFVGLWDLHADGALVGSWPTVSAVTSSAPAFVDDRWLAVARTDGELALYDLRDPQADAWMTWRALDGTIARCAALAGGLAVWRFDRPDLARRFDLRRLVDELAARGLAER